MTTVDQSCRLVYSYSPIDYCTFVPLVVSDPFWISSVPVAPTVSYNPRINLCRIVVIPVVFTIVSEIACTVCDGVYASSNIFMQFLYIRHKICRISISTSRHVFRSQICWKPVVLLILYLVTSSPDLPSDPAKVL